MKYNYHSHTVWCNHAQFGVDTLINHAIDHGYKIWGISEHIYSPYGNNENSLRNKENMLAYIKEANEAKEKYKDKIEVLVGFELDIMDPFLHKVPVDFINAVTNQPGVDFVLAGYHFHNDGKGVYENKPTPETMETMVNSIQILFEQTKVRYIAHPAAFVEGNGKWEEWLRPYAERIIKLAIKHKAIFGLNVNGIKKKRLYPCPEFWEIIGQLGATGILELDAHSDGPFNKEAIAETKELAKKAKAHLIEKWEY